MHSPTRERLAIVFALATGCIVASAQEPVSKPDDWQPTPAMIEAARGSNPRFNIASRVLAPEYTGLGRAELGQARQQGIPLARLIEKNGKSVDEYLSRTLKIAEGVLQKNIAEGLLDKSRADAIRQIMVNNVRAMVYGEVEPTERHLAQPLMDFELEQTGLSKATDQLFTLGKAIFKQNWVAAPSNLADRDGLGPRFNANSCNACHFRDGRSRPQTGGGPGAGLIFHLSVRTPTGEVRGDPNYGTQFHDLAVPGATPDGRVRIHYEEVRGEYAGGEAYSLRRPSYSFEELRSGPMATNVMASPRVANHLVGMGWLEAVPERLLLKLADPDDHDRDGISGRANRVMNRATGQTAIGRFGWKAGAPTVLQQTATAFVNDMGITSSFFPEEPFATQQSQLKALPHGGRPEIPDDRLQAVAAYASLLAVPPRRNTKDPVVQRGQQLFASMKCAACHVPRLMTDTHPVFGELTAREIEPFTDLLLHDMGPGLADGRPDGEANGNEWRTPPLWGIGLLQKVNEHTFLLHDGRARNFAEAILWHDGEAKASRESFRKAPREERDALLRFLESL
ncbi:MAG: c-type cytochrome [Verrucomicrobia bacterium]|nr:c-type cytochrome [Verrucomicrobiota bacterium]